MAATIMVGGVTATISQYKWTCPNQALKRMLDATLDPDGPWGSDPNPDHTAASVAIKKLGGKMIKFDQAEFDPTVKY